MNWVVLFKRALWAALTAFIAVIFKAVSTGFPTQEAL